MKRMNPTIVVLFFLVVSAFRCADQDPMVNIAVLELFTSEGCSSCPSADAAVTRLAAEFENDVIVLAYHVDYWNRLGWKDKFSRAEYTARQSAYARKFALNSIYTPQALVNGTEQLVGSEEAKLRSLIKKATGIFSKSNTEIHAVTKAGGEISVTVSSNASGDQRLNIALVQIQGISKVTAGENRGRELSHIDIVRELQTINGKKGTISLQLPEGLKPDSFKVVAFLQDSESLAITGASVARIM